MIAGQKFGRLTAIERTIGGSKPRWRFQCDCGNVKECDPRDVAKGGTKSIKSCGCLRQEKARTKRVIHGLGRSPEYLAWQKAKKRCAHDPNYIRRGIKMAEEWLCDPVAFITHIGPKPAPKHTVERIDNNRGYEPGNVRWATRAEQSRNTSRTVWVPIDGLLLPLVDACRLTNVSPVTASRRIRRGIPPERAVMPCP
jgi:hypothetical protein